MAAVLRHSSITAEPRDERLTEGIMNIHVKLTKQTITIPHHKGDEVYAFVVIIMAGVMGTVEQTMLIKN